MPSTTLTLIAAVADNGVIGLDGDMPWRLPEDLKRFKRLTMNKPMILGRRTFESLDGLLPGRRLIVLTRTGGDFGEGVLVAASLTDALALATSAEEVMIAGGSEIYAAALPLAHRMHLTHVHGRPEGDTMFPPWNRDEWEITHEEHHEADDRHTYPFTFTDYRRK